MPKVIRMRAVEMGVRQRYEPSTSPQERAEVVLSGICITENINVSGAGWERACRAITGDIETITDVRLKSAVMRARAALCAVY